MEYADGLLYVPETHQFYFFVCSAHLKITLDINWLGTIFATIKHSQRRISKTCTSMHYMLVFKQHRYTKSALHNIYPRTPREDVLNTLNIVTYCKYVPARLIFIYINTLLHINTLLPINSNVYHGFICAALICSLFGTHCTPRQEKSRPLCPEQTL